MTNNIIAERKIQHHTKVHGQKRFTGISHPGYPVKVLIFKQYLNTVIRNKIVGQLGKKTILKGKKIVIRVDDHCVYLMGELDSWEQSQEIKHVLENLETGRKILNRLTIRPKMNIYRFQRNLL